MAASAQKEGLLGGGLFFLSFLSPIIRGRRRRRRRYKRRGGCNSFAGKGGALGDENLRPLLLRVRAKRGRIFAFGRGLIRGKEEFVWQICGCGTRHISWHHLPTCCPQNKNSAVVCVGEFRARFFANVGKALLSGS